MNSILEKKGKIDSEKGHFAEPPLATITYNRYVKWIDLYVSRVIHNPIVACGLILVGILSIQIVQLCSMYSKNVFRFVYLNDYYMDILAASINIMSVMRFSMNKTLPSSLEMLLFIFQNFACYVIVFDKNNTVSFAFHQSNKVFTMFSLSQMVCPYSILILNFLEYLRNSSMTVTEFLIDSNNNFLPIFLSYSYMFVNFNFPYFDNEIIKSLYKIGQFSLKFYCILQFILYEIGVISYSTRGIQDFSIFYKFEAKNIKRTIFSRIYEYRNAIILISNSLVISIDLFIIMQCIYRRFI